MPGLLPPGKAASGRGGSLLYRDIHAPIDLLPDLAAARSRGRELILLTANWKHGRTFRNGVVRPLGAYTDAGADFNLNRRVPKTGLPPDPPTEKI